MIKASLDSPNFSFMAYGQTTGHAVNALKQGLAQHAIDYGLENDWWHEWSYCTEHIQLNRAYRDSELLKVPA
jgi:hypothetical protein